MSKYKGIDLINLQADISDKFGDNVGTMSLEYIVDTCIEVFKAKRAKCPVCESEDLYINGFCYECAKEHYS